MTDNIKVSVIIPAYNAENSLRRLLECVQNQTLQDFEAIIVNDGSADNTQIVIDKFCEKDKRFRGFSQTNQGVSAARNLGLDNARGKYITFYDSDDTVPADSMELLYNRAEETSADLVVGARTNSSLSRSRINKQSMRFAQKPLIDKYDEDFAYSFGLWNKLFKRDIIEDHHIRFEAFRNANDGIFVFTYLPFCNIIVGCDKVVYEYRKRLFYETASISQIKTSVGLKNICNALEHVKNIHDRMLDDDGIPANDERRHRFDEAFFYRIANVTFLDHYYRHMWEAEDEAVTIAIKHYNECKEKISTKMLEKLAYKHADIDIINELPSKSDILKHPVAAIVFSETYSVEDLNTTILSLYDQLFPSFAVYMPSALQRHLNEKFMAQPNMISYTGSLKDIIDTIVNENKSEYLMLIDDTMYFDAMSLRTLVSVLKENPDKEVSMIEPYTLDIGHDSSDSISMLHKLYSKKKDDAAFNASKSRWYDQLHVNKLIKCSALKDPKKRRAFMRVDWSELGSSVSIQRVFDKQCIYIKMTEDEIRNKSSKLTSKLKRKAMQVF